MNHERIQLISLSAIFLVVAIVVVLIWLPFLKLLVFGAILAILFLPVHKRILLKVKNKTAAAAVSLCLILLIVAIPVFFIGGALFNEALGLYNDLRSGTVSININRIIQGLPTSVQSPASNFLHDIGQRLSGFTGSVVTGVTGVIGDIAGFVLSLFLVIFTIFYLLRDGTTIKAYIGSILPLSEKHENRLIQKLEGAINGVIKGSFLVALIQGVVATIGFLIFGVPNAFLWGAFTVFAALVPTVGTSLSIIPIIIYLFISGHSGAAVGLAIWAVVAVSTVDNIVGPKLVGSTTDLHPLLVLFSILGGLQFFGFIGFLLGPIIMAVFVALLDIFREGIKEYITD